MRRQAGVLPVQKPAGWRDQGVKKQEKRCSDLKVVSLEEFSLTVGRSEVESGGRKEGQLLILLRP